MGKDSMLDKVFGYIKPQDNSEAEATAEEQTEESSEPESQPGNQDDQQGDHQHGEPECGDDEPAREHGTRLFDRDSRIVLEDKASLDLMIAVENAILAKRMSDSSVTELQNRLEDSRQQAAISDKDLERTRALLAEKEEQIEDLKQKLADKNVQIDHALEQYRRIESEMSETVDELKNRIDVEQRKYQRLHEQSQKDTERRLQEIEKRDQMIYELEGENANLKQQLDQAKQQNRYLLNVVRDFTDQVTGSLDQDSDEADTDEHSDQS